MAVKRRSWIEALLFSSQQTAGFNDFTELARAVQNVGFRCHEPGSAAPATCGWWVAGGRLVVRAPPQCSAVSDAPAWKFNDKK